MAEEDREDRSEAPSARRLQAAWDEGKIPLGRDLVTAAGFAAGALALLAAAGGLAKGMAGLIAAALQGVPDSDYGGLVRAAAAPVGMALAVCLAAAVGASIAALIQTRGGLWPQLAAPDLTRLFQAARFKRLLSREFLADLGLALVKLLALAYVLWGALRDAFLTLPEMLLAQPGALLTLGFKPLASACGKVLVTLAIIGGADLAITRFRFTSRMKMTREEAKREYREDEGDPLLRSRRRRRHRELARGQARVEVPRADALLVNPTHIAIALRYRKDEGRAPRVTAKGKGALAEHMRELARENGIPIVQDIPLARLLYRKVKVGREIPAETYRAVAAVLAFVYRLSRRGSAGVSP